MSRAIAGVVVACFVFVASVVAADSATDVDAKTYAQMVDRAVDFLQNSHVT